MARSHTVIAVQLTASNAGNYSRKSSYAIPCTLYAFDLAPLHTLSTSTSTSVSPTQSTYGQHFEPLMVQMVIDDESLIFLDNIVHASENMLYQSSRPKDLTSLVQRTWLCFYTGRKVRSDICWATTSSTGHGQSTTCWGECLLGSGNVVRRVVVSWL
jgi:hypothetical protein